MVRISKTIVAGISALAMAAAVILPTTPAQAQWHGGFHGGGGFRGGGGFHGGPYVGGAISTPPIFNPSVGYTVPTSPEAPVSPASPGSVFH